GPWADRGGAEDRAGGGVDFHHLATAFKADVGFRLRGMDDHALRRGPGGEHMVRHHITGRAVEDGKRGGSLVRDPERVAGPERERLWVVANRGFVEARVVTRADAGDRIVVGIH